MTLKLNGSSSGSVSIDAPASTAGGADRTLTLPDDAGNGVIKTSTYPTSLQILERFLTPCDGSTIATSNGNITVANVSSIQDLTTTHTDITGSTISYQPPTGTTQVIYEFHTVASKGQDSYHWTHYKVVLDGTDVTYSRNSQRVDGGGEDGPGKIAHFWAFNIGGTANNDTGRVASWSSAKTIKMQAREYNSNTEGALHRLHGWDGSDSGFFTIPLIGITAIGAA